ncbi:neurotrimin-like isoform X1 [Haliotis cracherodii]|uniref:neurotrimin-like isoform X1 n=1 Tax=Haliotis cracherodii TaxID=6455 RepID=UPI0039E823B5
MLDSVSQASATLFMTVCLWAVGRTDPEIRIIEPEFNDVPESLTYSKGETARLFCSVSNLGERTIVWRKVPNPHPVTIGTRTWTEDMRFHVDHVPLSNQWNLMIQNVTPDDTGKYECQISMRKKKLRQHIYLKVKDVPVKRHPDFYVSDIHISGTSYVEKGDHIGLFCNASFIGSNTYNLEWFKDGDLFLSHEPRISVLTFGGPPSERRSSLLEIRNSRPSDSGTYVCRSPEMLKTTSVQVHVMNAGSNNVKRAGSMGLESRAVGLLPRDLYLLFSFITILNAHWLIS